MLGIFAYVNISNIINHFVVRTCVHRSIWTWTHLIYLTRNYLVVTTQSIRFDHSHCFPTLTTSQMYLYSDAVVILYHPIYFCTAYGFWYMRASTWHNHRDLIHRLHSIRNSLYTLADSMLKWVCIRFVEITAQWITANSADNGFSRFAHVDNSSHSLIINEHLTHIRS